MSESTDLANTVVMPLVTPEQAKKQWEVYQQVKNSVLTETDFQKIGDGKYTKKSGFRKIATFFGLSDEILEKERVLIEDGFMWMFTVKVTAPNGRYATGVGICASDERKFAHLQHDVYATAHTRAKNRAISDLVAGGEISAEEMEHERRIKNDSTPKNVFYSSHESPRVEVVAPGSPDIYNVAEFFGLQGIEVETWDRGDALCYKAKSYLEGEKFETFRNLASELGASWDKNTKCYVIPL